MKIEIINGLDQPEIIKELFQEYTTLLVENDPAFQEYLDLQQYDNELEHLEHKYGGSNGVLYLALADGQPAGCIGMIRLDEKRCEMKRLYVRPEYRKEHIGKTLVDRLIAEAEKEGYEMMMLDTLPFLDSAIRLYERCGFVRTSPYNNSPMVTSIFMKLDLKKEKDGV